nr:hypothetical protein GCM10020092_027770 [Actinoplanes digitatis]
MTLVLVAAVTATGAYAVPAGPGQRLFNDAAQFVLGAVAAVVCVVAGRRRSGPRRHWRLLIGAGLATWARHPALVRDP